MALIKHSNAREIARNAVVLDLGDLQRQGTLIVQAARDQAAAIIAAANEERTRVLAGAADTGRAEGFGRGREEGLAAGREQGCRDAVEQRRGELEKIEAAWSRALAEFESMRDDLITDGQTHVLGLALAVAEKVTRRVVEVHPEVVVNQLAEALAVIARPTQLVVRVHPADAAIVREALPGLTAKFAAARSVELLEDTVLERGSCIASIRGENAGGEVDASVGTQIDRIIDALLPSHTRVTSPTDPTAHG